MRYIETKDFGIQGDLSISSGSAKIVIQNITIDTILEVALKNPNVRVSNGEFVLVEFPASSIVYVSEEFESEDYKFFTK